VPIPPGQVYAINDALSAEGAADDYEACLKQLVKNGVISMSAATGFPRFDLHLLGMDLMATLHLSSLVTLLLMRKRGGSHTLRILQNHHQRESHLHFQ